MQLNDTATWTKFLTWIKQQQSQPEPLLLIHDVDPDGVSSGKILLEALQKIGISISQRLPGNERNNLFNESTLKIIKENNITTILTTDINLFSSGYLQKQEELKGITFIVFDHHEAPLNVPPSILYFHPLPTFGFPDSGQYCTSKLVYDLLSNLVDLHELDWVASIGIIADANYKTWHELVDQTLQKLELPITKNPFDSKLARVGTYLSYALITNEKAAREAIEIYFNSSSYQQALEGLEKFSGVEKEFNKWMHNWAQHAEYHHDVIFVHLKSKYKINSIFSSKLSFKDPSTTYVVYSPNHKDKDILNFSLRRQDGKIDISKILKTMVLQIPGMTGGGHKQASGAQCQRQDFPKFKELFLQLHQAQTKV
ncbi:TPA: DHH family phosphoesterase [Candidatus Woesearchaeota archaeon]|nr:DHH family phosphoesterase [Candidatus Woesearchaeota archaeon]